MIENILRNFGAMSLLQLGGINTSKSSLGICKNDDCNNHRREGSAYCQECSDKFKNK